MANKDKTTKFRGFTLLICLPIVIAVLLANTLPKALADKHEDHPFSLTILHTNDLHAHDQSFQDRGKNIGGLARLGHLARQLHKNSVHCLLIDAGDIFQGTPMFTRYQGEVEVEMLNRIGYDLYTIGNHEFDSGGINLAKQLARARFKVLNCNLDTSALPQLAEIVKASEIVNFAPEPGQSSPDKVGFVGAITPDIENLSLSRDGVNLKRPVNSPADPSRQWIEPVREAVQALEAKGINKIVLVTHCGVDADRQLAENLPQVDAIIGGHSHTRLQHPIIVQHADGSTTTIVQTGCYGRNLGKLNLSFDKEGRVLTTRTQYELMPIDSRIPEDKDLADYITKMAEPLRNLRETVLCQAAGDFDNYFRSMKNDSALGNLICDAFYAAGQSEGTEITFENRGGIRSRIDRGPVTMEKVEELLPFENHLVFATVSGAQIRRALEHSISGATAGKFLDVHGLKLAWDPGAETGKRLIFAMAEKEGQWRPLQDNEKYKIAMTDYSFKGGEGYNFQGAENVHNTERKLNVYFKDYLSKLGTIRPECGNRIVAVSAALNKALVTTTAAAPLPPLRRARLSVYTADYLGVEQRGKLSLPLHNPQLVLSGNLRSTIAELAKISSSRLKNYCVFVLEGERRENIAYNDRLFTQVGSPLNKEEFLAVFATP